MRSRSFPLTGLLVLLAGSATAHRQAPLQKSQTEPLGVWTGSSICQQRQSACRDESVIYTITAGDKNSRVVRVSADKVVDGKRINMGSGDYDFDPASHTLSHSDQYGAWKLTVNRDELSGTMTLPDGTLFRRVSLKKSS